MTNFVPGLVVKSQSGFFWVRTDQGEVVCQLRGRLKQRRQGRDLVVVGDRVEVSVQPEGTGMLERVLPRLRALSRRAPGGRGRPGARGDAAGVEQVMVANPDQVVFVFACARPAPHLRMLDRFLVIAEAEQIPAAVCANKRDLAPPGQPEALFGLYARLGYPVVVTSAATGEGLDELRGLLRDKLSVLSGPSGVGKTSLLNALQPGLGWRAREISDATFKGRHTTVYAELLPLDGGGYVADTPGVRSLGLWDIEPAELDGYFVEFRPLVEKCAFSDCTHVREGGCAVKQAVAEGHIAASRYDSYVRLRDARELENG